MAARLPNFLIPGAAKSGTTALYRMLGSHPDIFFPAVKEPVFFFAQSPAFRPEAPGRHRRPRALTRPEYEALYAQAGAARAIGDANVDTLYGYRWTLPLLGEVLGSPRAVILLRNPVDRAYSAYLHLRRDGRETLSFEQGLEMEERRIREGYPPIWHYRAVGRYHEQVAAFRRSLPRVLVVLHEDLDADAAATVRRVCEFLEVDPDVPLPATARRYNVGGEPRWERIYRALDTKNPLQQAIRNTGSRLLGEKGWVDLRDSLRRSLLRPSSMKAKTRRILQDHFREDVLRLQDAIDRDLGGWLA